MALIKGLVRGSEAAIRASEVQARIFWEVFGSNAARVQRARACQEARRQAPVPRNNARHRPVRRLHRRPDLRLCRRNLLIIVAQVANKIASLLFASLYSTPVL